MATEVGHAFVSIIPSLDGFSRSAAAQLRRSGIDRQLSQNLTRGAGPAGTRAGSQFADSFNTRARVGIGGRGGVFAGLATTLRGGAAIAATALGAAGVAATTFGLKSAAAMEQAQIAFTTMLGSAKEAKVFIADLTNFAARTPFDLPGVRTAAQQLLAFGFAADDVIPTLTAIGDAAAGLGLGTEGLSRITFAIGQIQAKGRVQSEELLQLTEAGIPALKILAAQFGTTTAEMQAMVTKGLVPAGQAIPALLSGIENGTKNTAKFGGLMEKQAHTLGGLFSNLKDTATKGLGQAFTPVARLLEQNLPAVISAMSSGFDQLRRGIQAMIPAAQQAGPAIGDIFGFLRDDVAPIVAEMARTVFPALRDAFEDVASAFNRHREDFARLGGVLLHVGGVLAKVFGTQFALQLRIAGKALGFVIDVAGRLIHFLLGPFVKAVGTMVGVWATGVKFLADTFLSVVGVIIHGAAKAFGWVPFVGPQLGDAANKFDNFKASVDNTLSAIAHNAKGFGLQTGRNFVNGFGKAFAHGFNSIIDNVNHALSGIAGTINNFIKEARKTGPELAGNFNPNVNTGGGNLPLKHPLEKIKPKKAEDFGFDFSTSLADGIDSGVDASSAKVKKSFADLVDKILGPLRELKQKAAQLAKSIADGITGETGFGALGDRVDSLGSSFGFSVRSIIDTFKSQRREVAEFRRELRALERRGLSAGAIQDIAALGLEQGGGIADTLMGATSAQLKKLSKLRSGTNQAASNIGQDIAQNRFGERISRELVRTRRAIEKASHNTDLTDRTVRRLSHAYARAAKSARPYVDITVIDRRDGVKVATS